MLVPLLLADFRGKFQEQSVYTCCNTGLSMVSDGAACACHLQMPMVWLGYRGKPDPVVDLGTEGLWYWDASLWLKLEVWKCSSCHNIDVPIACQPDFYQLSSKHMLERELSWRLLVFPFWSGVATSRSGSSKEDRWVRVWVAYPEYYLAAMVAFRRQWHTMAWKIPKVPFAGILRKAWVTENTR